MSGTSREAVDIIRKQATEYKKQATETKKQATETKKQATYKYIVLEQGFKPSFLINCHLAAFVFGVDVQL